MAYERPQKELRLPKDEKRRLLKQYFEDYKSRAATDSGVLNQKLPRKELNDLLNALGEMLLAESKNLASKEGQVRTFLDKNPLSPAIEEYLSPEFRVFCLALNAIKQWVAAEQRATDCYLLGRDARSLCREVAEHCLGEKIGSDCELHHPVRDGRPPIPLSKHGHALIERQLSSDGDDPIERALSGLRRKGNRSWAQLRRGCLDLIGQPEPESSKRGAANDRAFAKKLPLPPTSVTKKSLSGWRRKGGERRPASSQRSRSSFQLRCPDHL